MESQDLAAKRVRDANARAVFYAALERAGFAHKRAESDQHGNPQTPIRLHDLRHSWCTWAVNVWPVTKVQHYAGHRDIQTTMRYVHHQTKAEDADLGGAYPDRVLAGACAPSTFRSSRWAIRVRTPPSRSARRSRSTSKRPIGGSRQVKSAPSASHGRVRRPSLGERRLTDPLYCEAGRPRSPREPDWCASPLVPPLP